MALRIDTFDNVRGGNALYKALAHPLAAAPGRALVERLGRYGKVAIVDPQGAAEGFAELLDLSALDIAGLYVQDVARIGQKGLGCVAEGVPALARSGARAVLIAAFDADRLIAQLGPFLPANCDLFSLDAMRIPGERLTNQRSYLDPLNFATNYALFRDTGAMHTRLVTANYWAGYGSKGVTCWLTLFDGAGEIIAEWSEAAAAEAGAIVIDSREVRHRFGLGEFAGQLFLHIAGAAGHDTVKYALDTYGSGPAGHDAALSCTHDANAWPSDRYAGLPAPASGERVLLWLQNSHAAPIPKGAIGLAVMGSNEITMLDEPIGAFATRVVDVAELLPGLAWPAQIELHAGKHMVRPRYEVIENGWRRIAHVNVERGDLKPNPDLPLLAETLGKGYLLPAPILPRSPMTPRVERSAVTASAGCRAGIAPSSTSIASARRSATATAMSNWSTILPRAATATAGCTRCSATAIAPAATPPRPALARMSSTRSSPIATSRNPIPADRPACRRRYSCVWATGITTRCAT